MKVYLEGEYGRAVEILEQAEALRSKRMRARCLLLRAAARHTLFILGGENDYAARGRAADDLIAARAADPEIRPTEAAFSPRFRDFFAATR